MLRVWTTRTSDVPALRQPALPRHDELRAADRRARLVRDHGPGPRGRHQLLRHRQRLRLGRGRGPHRADRRALVRPGRRPPGADGARDQAVRLHGRLAQRRQAVGAQHPARLRRVAARGCRPTTSTSTRCTTSTGTPRGRRSGRRWRSCVAAGQDPLRRLVELRRLAHRPGPGGRRPPALPRARVRAVDLQPAHPRRRAARCFPAAQAYGLGVIPWSPLHGGLLGGVLRKEREGSRRIAAAPEEALESTARRSSEYEDLCDELGEDPADRRTGVAAAPARRSPRRSSGRARWSSSTARCGRSSCRSRTRCSTGSTRSSPAIGPRPRTTPGRHGPQRGVGWRVPTVSPGVPRHAAMVSYRGAEPWWLRMSTTSPAVKCGPA